MISHRVLLLAPLVLMFAPELVRWLLTRFLGGDCEVDMRRGAKARGPADAVHRGEETKTHRREQSREDVTAPLNLAFGRKKGRLWLDSSRLFLFALSSAQAFVQFFLVLVGLESVRFFALDDKVIFCCFVFLFETRVFIVVIGAAAAKY